MYVCMYACMYVCVYGRAWRVYREGDAAKGSRFKRTSSAIVLDFYSK